MSVLRGGVPDGPLCQLYVENCLFFDSVKILLAFNIYFKIYSCLVENF